MRQTTISRLRIMTMNKYDNQKECGLQDSYVRIKTDCNDGGTAMNVSACVVNKNAS